MCLTSSTDPYNETLFDGVYSNSMDKENISQEWLMMGSPIPIITVVALYLLVVLKLGPDYMKDREPYRLKNLMRMYNIAQVLYNAAILYIFLTPTDEVMMPILYLLRNSCTSPQRFLDSNAFTLRYIIGTEILCKQIYSSVQNSLLLSSQYLKMSWYFLGLKILDLLDTLFMVMRKKTSHVTFLHVYHHSSTAFLMWFTFKYIKPIQGAIPVFLNLIVHVVMYSYYFLATFKPLKKYLWWKKHLTKLQLTQLVIIIAYLSCLYYNQCPMSRLFTYIWLVNVFLNLTLFLNFYLRAYLFKPKLKQNNDKIN